MTRALKRRRLSRVSLGVKASTLLPLALAAALARAHAQERPVEPGWLGVVCENANGRPVIARTVPHSPAQAAGIPDGAVAKAVDGRPVASFGDFVAFLKGAKPGQEVTLAWEDAAGKASSAKLTFAKRDYDVMARHLLEDGARRLAATPSARSAATALAARALAELPAPLAKAHEGALDKALELLVGRARTEGGELGLVLDRDAPGGRSLETWSTSETILALVARDRKKHEADVAGLAKALLARQLGRSPIGRHAFDEKDALFGAWPLETEPVGAKDSVHATVGATAHAVEALLAAGIPADHEAFKAALRFLERTQNVGPGKDGGFPDSPLGSRAGETRSYGAATGDGLRAIRACGVPRADRRVNATLIWMVKRFSPREDPGFADPAQGAASYYHYVAAITRAFEVLGIHEVPDPKGLARSWPNELIYELAVRQSRDGAFKGAGGAGEDDEVAATALALLATETCLRVKATE